MFLPKNTGPTKCSLQKEFGDQKDLENTADYYPLPGDSQCTKSRGKFYKPFKKKGLPVLNPEFPNSI